jgi:hypothetical protein
MRRGRPSKNNDDDKTDQHIIMQLRKAVLLNGQKQVEFRNGDTSFVSPEIAMKIISQYSNLDRPAQKETFQDYISYSLEQFSHYA